MVGALDLLFYGGVGQVVFQVGADEEVVDAPADVSGARAAADVPPGVFVGVLVEDAEGVDVAVVDEFVHPLALNRQEARDF